MANIQYMDKLVGKLVAELDRQHLREKTLLLFTGDNGTAQFGAKLATVNGHSISGLKGTMLEGGSRVPLIVNWPGVTPAGRVNRDLTDFSDFFATIAELAGAKLPRGVVLDSHSFAPQILGKQGSPREWVYVELRGESYVRGPRFKLTGDGKLFDMRRCAVQGDSRRRELRRSRGRGRTKNAPSRARPAQGGALDAAATTTQRSGIDRRRDLRADSHVSTAFRFPLEGRIMAGAPLILAEGAETRWTHARRNCRFASMASSRPSASNWGKPARADEGRADPYRQANVSYSLVKRRQAAVVRHTLIAGEERLPLAIGGLCGAE